ncbi:MAG: hypothetical protein ACUVRY_03915 [Thermoanaerobaculaceae bacterium]
MAAEHGFDSSGQVVVEENSVADENSRVFTVTQKARSLATAYGMATCLISHGREKQFRFFPWLVTLVR